MTRRFGAFLMITLGVVLITTGLPRNGAVVGGQEPTCGESTDVVGNAPVCPEGTINITKVDVPPDGPPTPQAHWSVDLSTDNCVLPQGGTSETVTVPDKSTGSSTSLYIFTDITSTVHCEYALVEEPVDGWSPSFAPPSPVTIPFDGNDSGSHEDVTLTNTSTVTPTPTPTRSSASPTPTPTHRSASPTPTPTHSASANPTASTRPVTLPRTGPSTPIGASLYVGVGLCLVGLFLAVVSGRTRRRPNHEL